MAVETKNEKRDFEFLAPVTVNICALFDAVNSAKERDWRSR